MNSANPPTLVTVAIPTFDRPELLRRALECVARQTHPALEVLVADNATEGSEVEAVVNAFRGRIQGLVYHRHPNNIGAVGNFFFCLARARGAYFMWLADDDELSPSAIEAMATILDHDALAVSAVPHWLLKRDPEGGVVHAARGYDSTSRLRRVLRFVWHANDAFFYALHRVEVLRRARRVEYVWPNRQILSNWAYPYLLDMVVAGKVVAVDRRDALWINHEYSEKSYARPSGGLFNLFRLGARRVNVHGIYVAKVFEAAGPAAALLVVVVGTASLLCELGGGLARRLRRRPLLNRPMLP